LSFNTARAFSIAPKSQNTHVSQSRAVVVGSTSKLQATTVQKRWHSQTPNDLKQTKVYQFDDVRYVLLFRDSFGLSDLFCPSYCVLLGAHR
jgi:hypothetical protein